MTFTYYFWYTISKILAWGLFSFRVLHRERLIEEGPVILASNHQSYFDPPLVGICSRRAVYYLARKTLLDIPLLGPLLPEINVIPVDRDGNDMSALKKTIRLIREGNGVVLFPEGTRSLDGNLQRGKGGIGLIIAKTRAPVQPMRIFGSYEAFPKGSGRIALTPISVAVGEPIRFTSEELDPKSHGGDERALYQYLSDRVMEAIAALESQESQPHALPLAR
ncbi:MAG: lysophospholipid acyltransferase family protein [bacterium]